MNTVLDDPSGELAVRARAEALIARAGNPVLWLERRITVGFTDDGMLHARSTQLVVPHTWIRAYPVDVIEAFIAHEMGHIIRLRSSRGVLALVARRLACLLRTLLWLAGLVSLAFVPISTAAAICTTAFTVGHVACHLLRRTEYQADAYAVTLVGAESMTICLENTRLPGVGRAVELAMFALGYGTHPTSAARIRRIRRLAAC